MLGLAGSGKSSLITECTGQDAAIGHNLDSCMFGPHDRDRSAAQLTDFLPSFLLGTTTVSLYSYDHTDRAGKKYKAHLVDTPGFDDLNRSDVEILHEIVFWLSCAYDNGFFLNGIIYLHSITAPRWTASSRRSLEIFKALVGPQNYKSVVLATTSWDDVAEVDDEQAQEKYKSLVDEYWKDIKKAGGFIQPPSYGYAWANQCIDHIVAKGTKHILQVQSELQVPGANLRDTTAGKTAGELWRLDDDRKDSIGDLDLTRMQLLVQGSKNVNEDIAALTKQIDDLNRRSTMSPPTAYRLLGRAEQEGEEQKLQRQRARDLDRVKERKLASYGMYVNTTAMVFGGIAAGVAILPFLACTVM